MHFIFRKISVLSLIFIVIFVRSQIEQTPWELIEIKQKSKPKPHLVFLHTDWCKHCKTMEYTTLVNKDLSKIINNNFYFTKLNGEEKNDINFYGKTFRYKPNGKTNGVHQLAVEIGTTNQQLTYPTLVLLSPENEILFQIQGFLSAKELMDILENIIQP